MSMMPFVFSFMTESCNEMNRETDEQPNKNELHEEPAFKIESDKKNNDSYI